MRRTLPLLIALLGALALPKGEAAAQMLFQGQAPVRIDVVSGLTLLLVRDISFGTAMQNGGPIVLAATSPGAGHFRIMSGRGNRLINLTLAPPPNLSNGTSTIPYTWAASVNENANDPATATAVPALTSTVRASENLGGGQRQAHLYLHGSVNVGNVTQGVYSGTFTVTVAY